MIKRITYRRFLIIASVREKGTEEKISVTLDEFMNFFKKSAQQDVS